MCGNLVVAMYTLIGKLFTIRIEASDSVNQWDTLQAADLAPESNATQQADAGTGHSLLWAVNPVSLSVLRSMAPALTSG